MVEESIRQHLYRRKSLRKTSKSGQIMGYTSSHLQLGITGHGSFSQMRHISTLHHRLLLQECVKGGHGMTQRMWWRGRSSKVANSMSLARSAGGAKLRS